MVYFFFWELVMAETNEKDKESKTELPGLGKPYAWVKKNLSSKTKKGK